MRAKTEKCPVFINEIVLDETLEQPIECDALLPDYCPDIGRILSCTVSPVLLSKTVSGGRLTAEGLADLRVVYLSEEGEPGRGEYKVPFTRVIELGEHTGELILSVELTAGEVICRAVSPRRLDIRGTVLLSAFAVTAGQEEAVASCGEESVQLLTGERTGVYLAGAAEREERVSGTAVLTGSPVLRVLWCEARIGREDCRVKEGRLRVTEEITARAVFLREDGSRGEAECTLPAECRLELPGAAETAPAEFLSRVTEVSAEPRADEDGEQTVLQFSVTVACRARLWLPYETRAASDCYGTRFETAAERRRCRTLELERLVSDRETLRRQLELPADTEAPEEVFLREGSCSVQCEGETLTAEARLSLFILARMQDGGLYGFTRQAEVSHAVPAAFGTRWNAALSCRSFSWEAGDGRLQIECDLLWSGALWRQETAEVLAEVTLDEAHPLENLRPRGFYLYLAEEGESLWEIARRYNTSVRRIRESNETLGDRAPGGAILIPV